MLTLPAPDFLHLTHRPDLDLLVARWQRQTTTEEMQRGYEALLAGAVDQQCRRWLVDARRRDHANQQGTPWMVGTFFPLITSQLGGSVRLAYLLAPTHLRELEADTTVPALTYFDNRPYRVLRFANEQPAMQWLAESH